ncbi:MAG TPA: hypothetical protein VFE47_23310 [Tepidisphaeraceae bacterium]|nr:hypothetical protein [Tepidisphaeraceae bacterium]
MLTLFAVGLFLSAAAAAAPISAPLPTTQPDAAALRAAADQMLNAAVDELRKTPEPRSGDSFSAPRWQTIISIASAQASLGNLEAAKATAQGIKDSGDKNVAFQQIALILAWKFKGGGVQYPRRDEAT